MGLFEGGGLFSDGGLFEGGLIQAWGLIRGFKVSHKRMLLYYKTGVGGGETTLINVVEKGEISNLYSVYYLKCLKALRRFVHS